MKMKYIQQTIQIQKNKVQYLRNSRVENENRQKMKIKFQ